MLDCNNIRGLAFDLDGTLINSVPGLTNALNMTLDDMQLPTADAELVTNWVGNGMIVLLERTLKWALKTQPEATQLRNAKALFERYYKETMQSGTELFPHVLTTLELLATRNMPLALVTNKPTPFVAPLMHFLGIEHYFSLVIGGDDVIVKKPHPAALFLVLGTFGLLPEELLFAGDSSNDILAAQAARCPCAGMTYGYNHGQSITVSHPDVVLDNFNELLPLLGLCHSRDSKT